MLAKCTNHACTARFRYLETGTLFRLESDPQCSSDGPFREYFWLCRGCSSNLTLRLDGAGGIHVAQGSNPEQRRNDGLDYVLLDRQNGRLLSRITLFRNRSRRHEKTDVGRVYL